LTYHECEIGLDVVELELVADWRRMFLLDGTDVQTLDEVSGESLKFGDPELVDCAVLKYVSVTSFNPPKQLRVLVVARGVAVERPERCAIKGSNSSTDFEEAVS
jgi:hypothetical protein